MASTLPALPIFQAIASHDPVSPAIIHSDSEQYFSYGSLLQDIISAKQHISYNTNGSLLRGERIAFLAENGYDYVGMGQCRGMRTLLTMLQ